jgi:hypothetical protein
MAELAPPPPKPELTIVGPASPPPPIKSDKTSPAATEKVDCTRAPWPPRDTPPKSFAAPPPPPITTTSRVVTQFGTTNVSWPGVVNVCVTVCAETDEVLKSHATTEKQIAMAIPVRRLFITNSFLTPSEVVNEFNNDKQRKEFAF